MSLDVYVWSWVVSAERAENGEGKAGYHVYFPDGSSQWMSEGHFELYARRLFIQERHVINMTDAEAAVSRISDGREPQGPP